MSILSRLRGLARNLGRRRDVERELDDELRAYVDLLTDEKVRAGLHPSVARRDALIQSGGVEQVKEHVRDARTGAIFDSIVRDVRHAMRGLARSPGFTLAVVATLTVGIGLNTAVFTIVYSALSRPLPVRDAGRVVNVYQRLRGSFSREVRGNTSFVSYAEFQAYAQLPAFASSAVYFPKTLTVAGVSSGQVPAELVSCDYFRTTLTRVALGRGFTGDECAHPGSGPVVVLSQSAWRANYGADPSVVGRVIVINNLPITVVGVAEPGFSGIGLQSAAMWVPITMQPALEHGRDSILVHSNASWLVMTARLAPGATVEEARTQAAVVARRLDLDHRGRRATAFVSPGAYVNFPEVSTEGAVPLVLTMLLGFTIVAMACANVMNLMLARGLARRREIGIRLAIGASRSQLIQQLLIESGLLALSGAALGLAFVFALPRILQAASPIGPIQVDASPDLRIVAYAFIVAIASTLLVGLLPALQSTSVDLVSAFKGATTLGRRQMRPSRVRSTVIGIQMGGSAMLLVMATLFVRGALRATSVDPGYITRNVVAFTPNLAALGYDPARAATAYGELTDRIARAPGVEGVAIASRLPLLSRSTESVRLEHDGGAAPDAHTVNVVGVSGSYFKTMGIGVLRGAAFDSIASGDGDRPAVISGSMATALWPNSETLGERFNAAGRWYRVVGIASEASTSSLARRADPTAYLAIGSVLDKLIIVRTKDSPAALLTEVPAWSHALDPQIVVQIDRLEDRITAALGPTRLIAGATASLGGLALLLAAIGVAGVVSFGLSQRRREIAVRLAIGATGRQVVTLMMRQGATPIIAGTTVGLLVAALLGQLVRGLLFGLSPLDPGTYALMIGVLLTASALATYLPARRAGRVDPALTLRDEG